MAAAGLVVGRGSFAVERSGGTLGERNGKSAGTGETYPWGNGIRGDESESLALISDARGGQTRARGSETSISTGESPAQVGKSGGCGDQDRTLASPFRARGSRFWRREPGSRDGHFLGGSEIEGGSQPPIVLLVQAD